MLFRDISKDIYTKKKIVLGIALLTEEAKQRRKNNVYGQIQRCFSLDMW